MRKVILFLIGGIVILLFCCSCGHNVSSMINVEQIDGTIFEKPISYITVSGPYDNDKVLIVTEGNKVDNVEKFGVSTFKDNNSGEVSQFEDVYISYKYDDEKRISNMVYDVKNSNEIEMESCSVEYYYVKEGMIKKVIDGEGNVLDYQKWIYTIDEGIVRSVSIRDESGKVERGYIEYYYDDLNRVIGANYFSNNCYTSGDYSPIASVANKYDSEGLVETIFSFTETYFDYAFEENYYIKLWYKPGIIHVFYGNTAYEPKLSYNEDEGSDVYEKIASDDTEMGDEAIKVELYAPTEEILLADFRESKIQIDDNVWTIKYDKTTVTNLATQLGDNYTIVEKGTNIEKDFDSLIKDYDSFCIINRAIGEAVAAGNTDYSIEEAIVATVQVKNEVEGICYLGECYITGFDVNGGYCGNVFFAKGIPVTRKQINADDNLQYDYALTYLSTLVDEVCDYEPIGFWNYDSYGNPITYPNIYLVYKNNEPDYMRITWQANLEHPNGTRGIEFYLNLEEKVWEIHSTSYYFDY